MEKTRQSRRVSSRPTTEVPADVRRWVQNQLWFEQVLTELSHRAGE